jgi:hypothetical protein
MNVLSKNGVSLNGIGGSSKGEKMGSYFKTTLVFVVHKGVVHYEFIA